MTDNNKQAQEPNEVTETTPEASKTAKPTQPKTELPKTKEAKPASSLNTFAALSLGLSAIAIATSGWLYFQSTQSTLHQDIQQLAAQQIILDQKLNDNTLNKTQLTRLVEQVKTAEQTILQQKNELTAQQNQQSEKLLSLESKLNRLNNTTKEDWKLAEAEYLIRLANQRLLLESDSNGAITLLINADDILNELEDPIVFTTRKSLAKDIQALKSINPFDLEGAYLKLNALYDNVASLPQREPSKEWQKNTTDNTTIQKDSTGNKIASTLNDLWSAIRSLVVINYNHKPIKALLPPAEYQELITGMQLQLEVAQIALIKGEPIIYQKALERIANATTEHFETQSSTVISFLASLTALQQLNPSPNLPLPRESLTAMKLLMKEWNHGDTNTPSATKDNITEPKQAEDVNTSLPQTDIGDKV